MIQHCTSALVAALAFSNVAYAQQAISEETESEFEKRAVETAKDTAEDGGKVMSNGSPTDRATAGFSTSNLQFTNEQGETEVSLAFSLDLGTSSKKGSASRGGKTFDVYHVSRQKLSIVATAPIDTSSKASNLFAGDSLVTGTKLKVSYSRFSTNLGDGSNARDMRVDAYRTCVERNASIWAAGQNDRDAADSKVKAFLSSVGNNLVKADTRVAGQPGMTFAAAISTPAGTAGDLGTFVSKACVISGEEGYALGSELDLVNAYGKDSKAFAGAFFPDRSGVTFWGLDASMGRDDKSFLDRTNFKLLSEPRTTWEVGAYYGLISSDLTWSLRGRVVYGQTYKDNDEAEICRSVSIPVGGTDCIKGPDGAPIRERTGLASVEARKLVTVNDKTQIALAPQVTYRFEDKNVGVEVPIYLVPDEKGKLSGGIKAVYNSKGDEFAVGLFVGVPFSIFFDK